MAPQKPTKPTSKPTPAAAPPTPPPAPTTTAPASAPTSTEKTSGLAVAALVLAFLFPIIGLILGIVALSSVKKSGEKGKGLAKAAIIVSIVIMLFWALVTGVLIYSTNKVLKDNGVNVNNSGTVSVTGKDGNSVSFGNNAKLPEGFPTDVPLYKPSDLVASAKTKGNSYTASLLTTDSVSQVNDFYASELPKNGWQTSDGTAQFNFSSGTIATFTKGDQTLGVLVASDSYSSDKKTSITLTVTPTNPTE